MENGERKLVDDVLDETKKEVECLGLTFKDDEERKRYFSQELLDALNELEDKLGDVPFLSADDAAEKLKSLEKWPVGDDEQIREIAERMRRNDHEKDLLQRWKDEVGFPHGSIEDIMKLSDPPYYTPCPNPFITDYVSYHGKMCIRDRVEPEWVSVILAALTFSGDLVVTVGGREYDAVSYTHLI